PIFLAVVVLIMVASAVAVARALGGRWTLAAMLTILLVVPIGWFGQREHIAIALIFPWLVSTLNDEGAGWPLGIAAGIGVGLKPHLFLVFLLILSFSRRLDPGSRAVLWTLAAYVAAVAVFAPGYVALAHSLGSEYWSYQRVELADLLWKN